jgi:hypothetical protein
MLQITVQPQQPQLQQPQLQQQPSVHESVVQRQQQSRHQRQTSSEFKQELVSAWTEHQARIRRRAAWGVQKGTRQLRAGYP